MDGRLSIRDARELGVEWVKPAPADKHFQSMMPKIIAIRVGAEPADPRDPDHVTYFDADYPGGIQIPVGGQLAIHGITVTRHATLFEPYRGMKPGSEEWNKAALDQQRRDTMGRPRVQVPTEKTALGKDRVPAG